MGQKYSKALVDVETGEVIHNIYDNDKIIIYNGEQQKYNKYHNTKFKNGSFIKVYDDVIKLLYDNLTPVEFKFFMGLFPLISYEDCVIRKSRQKTSAIADMKGLAESMGFSYDHTRHIIPVMIDKNLIAKLETKYIYGDDNPYKEKYAYAVNPFIVFRGNNILTTIYQYFKTHPFKNSS